MDDEVVGAETNGNSVGGFDGETHHDLVDGTDLQDVEGTVGDEVEEILEDAEEHVSETSSGSITAVPESAESHGRPLRKAHASGSKNPP